MTGLGNFLKEAREKKSIRLADIASVTKIPLYQLKLIEDNNWTALPARPFLKGFLSAYCRYVGLDADEIWQRYLTEVAGTSSSLPAATADFSEDPLADTPRPVTVTSKVFPINRVLTMLVIAALGGSAYWIIGIGKGSSPQEARELASAPNSELTSAPAFEALVAESTKEFVPVVASDFEPSSAANPVSEPVAEAKIAEAKIEKPDQKQEVPEKAATLAQEDPSVSAPSSEGHRLEIDPEQKTWVKIVIDDSPPVTLYLEPHQKTSYEAKNKIKLVLGNATGAEVLHNGNLTEGHIDKGSVKYYIFPWGSKFPQDKRREVSSEETSEGSPELTE